MLSVLDTLLALATAAALLPLLTWSAECLLARPVTSDDDAPPAPPFSVVVPAHDEADGIAATLADIQAQLRPGDRLLVVADNCRDATAARAARCGADVVIRTDPVRRGKGYALAFGVDHVAATGGPATLIVIDADCRLAPRALERLARAAVNAGCPVQGDYQLVVGRDAALGARLSAFAVRVKNVVRPLGGRRLGWAMPLGGTGMAFPPGSLAGVDLATGAVVEDLVLSLDLALRGRFVRFVPAARITSAVAPSDRGRDVQRERWVTGHLAAARRYAPRLLAAGLRRREPRLIGLGLDLLVPPLMLLAAVLATLALAGCASAILEQSVWPLLAVVPALIFAAVVMATWSRFGRDLLSARELCAVPLRLARKLPEVAALPFRSAGAWTRTER